jgi:HPt (histidine-containing phosphotransfer) domain-containing protein
MSVESDEFVVVADDAQTRVLTERYLEQRRLELVELRAALARGDFEALWIAGHHMHGAGGSFGVEKISRLGAGLEFSAFARDPLRVVEHLDQLDAFLARIEVV